MNSNILVADFRTKKKPNMSCSLTGFEISAINFISRYQNWDFIGLESRIDKVVRRAYSSIQKKSSNERLPEYFDWHEQDIYSPENLTLRLVCPDIEFKNTIRQKIPFIDPTRFTLNIYVQSFVNAFNNKTDSYTNKNYLFGPDFLIFPKAFELAEKRRDYKLIQILKERDFLIENNGKLIFTEPENSDDFAVKGMYLK